VEEEVVLLDVVLEIVVVVLLVDKIVVVFGGVVIKEVVEEVEIENGGAIVVIDPQPEGSTAPGEPLTHVDFFQCVEIESLPCPSISTSEFPPPSASTGHGDASL
jgi:hypothetical protein